MNRTEHIDTPALRELASAGAIDRLTARGVHGGFQLIAQIGLQERVLRTQRGGPRLFRSLDAIVPYMKSLGMARFDVSIEHLSTGGLFKR